MNAMPGDAKPKLIFKSWTIPFAFLGLIMLGFGLLIPWLGFYQDDWYMTWMPNRYGLDGLKQILEFNRPLLVYIYLATTKLIGLSALRWQIFGLLTRWLAVLVGYWVLRTLWPRRTREAVWIAMLFAIYPAFKQHYLSVTYSQTYLLLAAHLYSIGAMLLTARRPAFDRRAWLLTLSAVAAAGVSLISTEYFFGLELLRPVLLWIVINENGRAMTLQPPSKVQGLTATLRKLLPVWAPYLALDALFLAWRLGFGGSMIYGSRLTERLAAESTTSGMAAGLLGQLQVFIQDAFEAGLFAWLQTLDFLKTTFPSLQTYLAFWLVVIGAAALTAFYLLRLRLSRPDPGDAPEQGSDLQAWYRQAVLVGACSMVVSGVPFWFAGLQIELAGTGFDRFTLAFMFGSAILVVGLLVWFVKTERLVIFLLSGLVGFSVLFQLRTALVYVEVHKIHSALFHQLAWRAPALAPGTRLLINDLPVEFSGNSSMTTAFSWLYSPIDSHSAEGYEIVYSSKIGTDTLPDLEPGPGARDILVANFSPAGCLQVLDPDVHRQLPRLNETIEPAIKISNLGLIDTNNTGSQAALRQMFGRPPPPGWCYYFEKADLARQRSEWEETAALGDQAFQAGHKPAAKSSSELLPFIEAYGRLERWGDALALTQDALNDVPSLEQALCTTWERVIQRTSPSVERDQAIKTLSQELACLEP